jgi:hypothetical protein
MALRKRLLRVTFTMPGNRKIVFNESVHMTVQVSKSCLKFQQSASIEIFNLTQGLRDELLSHMSEWNLRLVQTGRGGNPTHLDNLLIPVKIEAGYEGANASLSTIFIGEVTTTKLTSIPPNIGVTINASSRQLDKSKESPEPPTEDTYKNYVIWAAKAMGVTNYDCETSYDNLVFRNLFSSTATVSGLIWAIQGAKDPHTVAYIDNDTLTVRDLNKPLAVDDKNPMTIEEFIGIASQTSYGAEFQVLFDPRIHLSGVVNLNSEMNPSLGTASRDTRWLLFKLDYMLSSRDNAFYTKACVYPAA